MFNDPKFYLKLIPIALQLSEKIARDEQLQKQIFNWVGNVSDFVQVATGNVNQRSQEESLKLALETCIRKDPESQLRVTAFITGLYLQYATQTIGLSVASSYNLKLHRGAQVGGSLLKHFGRSYFPHIAERELKYALDVDTELFDYLYLQLKSATDEPPFQA